MPEFGETTGGLTVTLTGSRFQQAPLTVLIGDRPARDVSVESDTRLTCVVPSSGTVGPVDVTVANASGSATLVNAFTYIAVSTLPALPELLPLSAFDLDPFTSPLLTLHEAMLRIGEARRDLIGLLSLPVHFERQDALDWQSAFRRRLRLPERGQTFDLADLADLSFVAAYHPWILLADGTVASRMRTEPPDGAVAGMIAARERERGVWVAPANLPLQRRARP